MKSSPCTVLSTRDRFKTLVLSSCLLYLFSSEGNIYNLSTGVPTWSPHNESRVFLLVQETNMYWAKTHQRPCNRGNERIWKRCLARGPVVPPIAEATIAGAMSARSGQQRIPAPAPCASEHNARHPVLFSCRPQLGVVMMTTTPTLAARDGTQ